MAFVAPRTWTVGDDPTAVMMNQEIRDNMDAAAGAGKAACRIYNSAAIGIVSATPTALTFDSERYDRQGCHSTTVNTSHLTFPTGWGGLWDIGGCVDWASNATGYRQVYIRLNGTTVLAMVTYPVVAAIQCDMNVSTTYAVAANDYVELVVTQTSGAGLNIVASPSQSPEFWATWRSA
jgi:hypothetical protein